jgi:uncharacterized membrane protein
MGFMFISCSQCAAEMPDSAAYCPGCGQPMHPAERGSGRVGALTEPVAGALAYLTVIPAIIFLLIEPYKGNRFVRFHSFQCILAFLAVLILALALKILSFLLLIVPVLGHLLIFLISLVVALAVLVMWLVLVVKALQGESFKLPLLGDFAEQQASAM